MAWVPLPKVWIKVPCIKAPIRCGMLLGSDPRVGVTRDVQKPLRVLVFIPGVGGIVGLSPLVYRIVRPRYPLVVIAHYTLIGLDGDLLRTWSSAARRTT